MMSIYCLLKEMKKKCDLLKWNKRNKKMIKLKPITCGEKEKQKDPNDLSYLNLSFKIPIFPLVTNMDYVLF